MSHAPEELVSLVLDDLRSAGYEIREGLEPAARASLEARLGFRFPPDLAVLLASGVPSGDRFPDWHGPVEALVDRMRSPIEGLLFDVEHNDLWLDGWGERPSDMGRALALAENQLQDVPPLVPVWGHRFLPTLPNDVGNPVLSVHQADIIVYGNDLGSYLAKEFELPERGTPSAVARDVPFWSQFVC